MHKDIDALINELKKQQADLMEKLKQDCSCKSYKQ